jgi:hypothetical protein
MNDKIRVGPKGRHVNIPEGWYRITSGTCISRDQFADTRSGRFRPVESEDLDMPADSFDCLIRKTL